MGGPGSQAGERAYAWLTERYPALSAPAYRRLALSVGLAETGLFVFEVALAWAVLDATGSSAAVGLLYAALIVPIVVLIVPGGVLSDRFGPRPVMLSGVAGSSVVIAVGAIVAASGEFTALAAFALAGSAGACFAFWVAPSQVMASRVVEPRHVASAIGFGALPTGIGAILGGALGGVTVELGGIGLALAIAATSLVGSTICVWGLPRLPGAPSDPPVVGTGFRDGLRWINQRPHVLALLAISALGAVFFMSRIALYPAFVSDVLLGGPSVLGWLISAGGLGWVVASLTADRAGSRLGRGRTLLVSLVAAGVGLALLGSSTLTPIAILIAAVASTCFVVHQVTAMMVLQLATPTGMRGRVVSVFIFTRVVTFPAGTLTIGLLADRVGPTLTYLAFGVATVLAAVAATTWLWSVDVDVEGELVRLPSFRAPPGRTTRG